MKFRLALAAVIAAALPGTASLAGVPSAANSTLPGCLLTSPNGAFLSVVVVRDLAGNPLIASTVVLDYSGCAGFSPCPQTGDPPDPYLVDLSSKTIRMQTDAQGQAAFRLRAGGGCSDANVIVYADGVLLGARRSASTDQNADQVVNNADQGVIADKFGTSDLSGDLNCDGVVDIDDGWVLIVAAFGASCSGPVPVLPSSWGRLKLIYR